VCKVTGSCFNSGLLKANKYICMCFHLSEFQFSISGVSVKLKVIFFVVRPKAIFVS
jgi:hypothetical protein